MGGKFSETATGPSPLIAMAGARDNVNVDSSGTNGGGGGANATHAVEIQNGQTMDIDQPEATQGEKSSIPEEEIDLHGASPVKAHLRRLSITRSYTGFFHSHLPPPFNESRLTTNSSCQNFYEHRQYSNSSAAESSSYIIPPISKVPS